MATATTGTTKKVVKHLTKKVQWRRPVRVRFNVEFGQGSRKLTPADIDRATQAAAAAFRASLEGRYKPYVIERFEAAWEYLYRQGGNTFNA